jgi:anti-sigma factor RsiW
MLQSRLLEYRHHMISDPINELDVHALVDSQLNWEEEKRVLREIENNPFLRKEYVKLLEQKKIIASWWKHENKD